MAAIVAASARGMRAKAVGRGHSFSGAAVTDGLAIDLSRHCRLLDVDAGARTVTVEAGMTLDTLNRRLAGSGLALPVLGDVAVQSVGGALATGTHGTARRGPAGLAASVAALELVTADGSVRSCSAGSDPDLFEAARVGLGALGIVSAVTMQVVPSFNLHALERVEPLERVLGGLEEAVGSNDHFEFFWVPHTRSARTKRNNRTAEGPRDAGLPRHLAERVALENVAFGAVCRAERLLPALTPRLAPLLATGGRREWVERSYRVFTSPRYVRFVEMEYALPVAAAAEAVEGLARIVERERLAVAFPVEVRFSPAEDVWMSTARGRDTAYVAVHQYRGMPHERYFALAEELMVSLGGRPHWGKLHTRSAAELRGSYPEWDRWAAQRRRVDPGGMWANAYLDRVVGPPPGGKGSDEGPGVGPFGAGRGEASEA